MIENRVRLAAEDISNPRDRFLNNLLVTGITTMSGKTDEVKGRIKEAAGALTGNDKLRAEGKTDQSIGKVKQVAKKAVDEVKQAAKKVSE